MSRRIAMTVSYDGTDFCGWQIQNGVRTVQNEMEKSLMTFCPGGHCQITASGRTDSGVHSAGQVVHFDTDNLSIPPERFREAFNSALPRDIRVLKSWLPEEGFHARYSARAREYRYYILNRSVCPATMASYCWPVRESLNLKELDHLAVVLAGVHDFTLFTAAGDPSESRVREIFSAGVIKEGPFLVFRIVGNAFLWKMVRSIVGTLVLLHRQGAGPNELIRRLESQDRSLAGITAPAKGLFLYRVVYDRERALL